MNVYESFAREYRRLYNESAERSKLAYGSEQAVEALVQQCVTALDATLDGTPVHIAYLAMSHVPEHHFMEKMDGR